MLIFYFLFDIRVMKAGKDGHFGVMGSTNHLPISSKPFWRTEYIFTKLRPDVSNLNQPFALKEATWPAMFFW